MAHNQTNWTADSLNAAMASGVSYCGALADLTHEEFVESVASRGGRYIRFSNHGVFAVLVIGAASLPMLSTGEPIAFPAARLIPETEFVRLLGIVRTDNDRLFTARMLAELMNIPEARINAWAKAGLINPVAMHSGVARFEFRQAAIARTLSEMTAAGVTIDKLRRTLHQLRQGMPNLREPLQQLTILEHNGPLLVRLESGDLAEITGQMQLHFENGPQPEPRQLRLVPTLTTATDWHERAIEQERAGLFAEAEQSYRQAMMVGGPSPQCAFDLANLLSKLGQLPQAIERYAQAIELDPDYTDAWNNMGILKARAGDLEAACDSFRRALALTPDDPKLHYNLADALDTLGFCEEARRHWKTYLRYDPVGTPWSDYAREKLRARA